MSESLSPICSDLQQRVATAQLALHAAKEELKGTKSEIEAEIAGNPFWGGGREKNQQEIELIERLTQRLKRAEKNVAYYAAQLAAAERAFNESGFQLCGAPNRCEGDKLSDFIIKVNLPKQVTYSADLKQENTTLTAEIEKLIDDLKECLYIEFPNTPRPNFDFSNISLNTREQIAALVTQSTCTADSAKRDIINILVNRKSFFVAGKIKPTALRQLDKINLDDRQKQKETLAELLAEEHPKQLKIAANNRLITVYDNPDSAINKNLRTFINDKLKAIAAQCLLDNPIKYTSTTIITATAGPAAPAGATNVSKTLDDHGCVTLSEFQFSLDPIKAIDSLGPGGCDIKEKKQLPDNGPVVEVGSYWTYPVNVTTTININQETLNNLISCINNKIDVEFESKKEPVGGKNGARWPVITPNYTLTLTTCVSAPKLKIIE